MAVMRNTDRARPRDLESVARLKPGDHLCGLYENEEEHRQVLAPYLRQGLLRNEKVLYITDTRTDGQILDYLRGLGVDVEPYLSRGQLAVVSASDVGRPDEDADAESLDPDSVLAFLKESTAKALEDGWAAFRVTTEMTWALQGPLAPERLVEYEAKVDRFFTRSAAIGICQYDMRRFSPELLGSVIDTHPLAVVGTHILENPSYVPPAEYLGKDRAQNQLRRRLDGLLEGHRTQRHLIEKERILDSLILAVDNVAWAATPDGATLLYISPTVEALYGCTVEEAMANPSFWLDRVHPDDRDRAAGSAAKLLEAGKVTAEYRVVRADGSCRWILDRKVVSRDANGIVVQIGGLASDITEFKRVERRLTRAVQRLETVLDTTHVLIAYLDPQLDFIRVNRAYAEAHGRPCEDFEGQNHLERFPDDEIERVFEQVRSTGVPQLGAGGFEHAGRHDDEWAWGVAPTYDADGRYTGLVITLVEGTHPAPAH